jgi:Arc/MetJ-type ribon-helix-helix transcriptional regulator
MKVSISLPQEDIEFLDSYARFAGIQSRSAAVHRAVGVLRASQMESAYEQAWAAWDGAEEADEWDSTVADGLGS